MNMSSSALAKVFSTEFRYCRRSRKGVEDQSRDSFACIGQLNTTPKSALPSSNHPLIFSEQTNKHTQTHTYTHTYIQPYTHTFRKRLVTMPTAALFMIRAMTGHWPRVLRGVQVKVKRRTHTHVYIIIEYHTRHWLVKFTPGPRVHISPKSLCGKGLAQLALIRQHDGIHHHCS